MRRRVSGVLARRGPAGGALAAIGLALGLSGCGDPAPVERPELSGAGPADTGGDTAAPESAAPDTAAPDTAAPGLPDDRGGSEEGTGGAPGDSGGPEELGGPPDNSAVPVEAVPDAPPQDGSTLFLDDVIHTISLTIDAASWDALTVAPREYAPAIFSDGEQELEVAIRLKGNTQFRVLSDKPSLVIDFNRYHDTQRFHGLPSVYLHNMTYDPSMLHEHTAYWFFRSFGVPASRTSYARLSVNGMDYGLYLFVEKQNKVYREQWWADPDGSLYETGSFNHGCDLNDTHGPLACDCFEVDDPGADTGALDALCREVSSGPEGWYERVKGAVDMELFLRSMAAEMLIAHYDNYGWNRNNFRIYHEPGEDLWYFTPWSTDLAFGWYPWVSGPHCGYYGQSIYEYQTGYLLSRCWGDADCEADLLAAVAEAADAFEALDVPGEIERVYKLIAADAATDTRRWYGDEWFEREVTCAAEWAASRPFLVRLEL